MGWGHNDPIAVEHEIALRMMRRVVDQNEMRQVRRVRGHIGKHRDQAGVVEFGIDIAIGDDEGRLAQQMPGPGDAAGGLQRRPLIRPDNAHTQGGAIAQGGFEPHAQVGVIDDQIVETGIAQAFDLPDDQRFAAGHEQGLRGMVGERAHALAQPGGKDHRFGCTGQAISEGIPAAEAVWPSSSSSNRRKGCKAT
jgi:hypothetical protein